MDITVILTIVGTTLAIIGSNIALISWLRSDMKSFENKMETNMKDFENKSRANMKEFQTEIAGWKTEIYKEMRDFHGRLCAIDERTGRNTPKTDP